MKFEQYLLCLMSVIIILLLWQIVLITITLKDNLSGINFNSVQTTQNQNQSAIPRIIHQMWKTTNLLTYPINNSHSEWKKLYPDYKIRLWTDEDVIELLLKDEYKYLYSIYVSYPYSIQRADLARLIILHHEGGIYADLDVFPCSRKVENLRLSNVSLIIPRSSSGSSLINHFLVAQKSSKLLFFILHEVVSSKFYQRIYVLPYLEVFSTGSTFLTRVIKKYLQSSNDNANNFLWILSENDVINYVIHENGRSWHSFDGFILNFISDQPKMFSFIVICSFLSIFLIFKSRNYMFKFLNLNLILSFYHFN
jgi:mannosyltransferase OCH1-like enzyme